MKKILPLLLLTFLWTLAIHAQTTKKQMASDTAHIREEDGENEDIETALEHAKQKWFKLMQKPNADYFKVKSKFDRYFRKHPLEGSAPKEFGLEWLKTKLFYLDRKGRVQPPPAFDYNKMEPGSSPFPSSVTDTTAGDWHMLGPSNVSYVGAGVGNNGGYGYCVRMDPTNPNKLFIGFVTGGLWVSADNGNSWHLSDANMPQNNYYDIDVCRANNNIVYAISNSAVIKSTDGGMSWNATAMNSSNYTGQAYDIAASPTNPNVVLARWGLNVYRSIDGGASWSVVTSGLQNFSIWDSNLNSEILDWDINHSNIAYFTDRSDNQNYVNVYRSLDSGATFNLFSTLTIPDTVSAGSITGWSKISTATNDTSSMYVFIGSGQNSYGHEAAHLFKLDIRTGNILLQRIDMINGLDQSYGSSSALVHGDMAMDITNENNIVWGSYSQQNAYYSLDNGVTFSPSTTTLHADLRSIYVMNGKVILGTDGSTVISTDSGNNFTIASNGISNHELWGFGSAFNSDILAAGCNHGPLMIRDYAAPGGWYTVLGADQGNSDFNPLDSVTAYSQGYDSYHVTRTGIKTFTNSSQELDPGGIYSYFNTMEFHPNLYHTLITHHAGQYPSYIPQATKNIWKNSLIRSDDNGITVNVVYTFPAQLFREKICMSDTTRIYTVVGLSNNSLMRTEDAGATWTNITPPASITTTAVTNISDIAVSDVNPNEIWVTYSGVQNTCQVLHSTDGGVSYTNLTTPILTSNPVTKIIFQRGTNGGVYVGNEAGIFYRNDSMPNWVPLGQGLPQMDKRFMFINYAEGKLRIGTDRGAWDHNLYEHSSTRAQISASSDRPNCQSPTVQFRDYSVASNGGNGVTYAWSFPGGTPDTSNAQNPLVSYMGSANAGLHDVSLTVTDQYGTSTQKLPNFIYYDNTNCCQGPPSGWQLVNIGGTSLSTAGELCYTPDNGNFKITSNLSGFSDPNDSVPFVYQTMAGNNMQIVARVKDVSSTYNYGGGIMILNSLSPSAAFVFLNSLDTRGIFDLYRLSDGGGTNYQDVTALPMPMWLKLVKYGNTVNSFYSADSISWVPYHTYTFASLNDTVYVGLSASGSGCVTDIDKLTVGHVPPCIGGSVNGCPAYDTIPGHAIDFYDYSYIGIPLSAPSTNNFTITGWIKPQGTLGSQSSILAWDNGYFYMGQNNDNQLEYVWNSGNPSNTWNSGLFVPADKWSFVAMVVHPDRAKLYLNDQVATDTTIQGMSIVGNCYMGNSNQGGGYFLGQMDELTVWNRALSTHEIDSLRHLTKEKLANPANASRDSSLIGYFQFNDSLSASSYNQVDSIPFNFGYGANKLLSTAPVGAGSSSFQTISGPGNYSFDNTGITLTLPASGAYPHGDVWVSKINQLPDQYPHSTLLPNAYWIIDNYGLDSSFSKAVSLQIDKAIDISTAGLASPGTFKLYRRLTNAEGWTWGGPINSASRAIPGTPGNLIFRYPNITSEGQLFVNGGIQAPQPDSVAGKALDLTPSGDPVIPLSPIPINSNTFSIMLWVKPLGLQIPFSQIISSNTPNSYFGIGFGFPGYTNNLNLVFTSNAIPYGQLSNINLVADQWNHVALTYSPDSVSIFLNGGTPWTFPAASSNTPSGFPPIDLSEAAVTINADIHAQLGNFKGQIDEVSFYDYQLSQQQIREKMHLTKTPETETGLVGYYQFNQYDSQTDTLYDAMGYGTPSPVPSVSITASTAPVAAGTSFRLPNVTSPGAYDFTGTGMTLTFPGPVVPNGEMVVSRLNSLPDSLPTGYQPVGNQYWIVHNWGSNANFTALASMQLDSLSIKTDQSEAPRALKLLERGSPNEYFSNWVSGCIADAHSSGTEGSVTFSSSCGIDSVGQFLVGSFDTSSCPAVTLSNFSVQKQQGLAQLQWDVPQEAGLTNYVIERSEDGKTYSVAGIVSATNSQHYSFTDGQQLNSHNYYRLKMEKKDGGCCYSYVVSIDLDALVRITPNPVLSTQTLRIQNLDNIEIQLTLYLSDGQKYRTYTVAPGGIIEVANLPKGFIFYDAHDARGKNAAGVEIVL